MKKNTLFISLILLLIASMTAVKISATPTPPVVSLNPMESTVQQGESFMINVTVANVTDLGAWEFKLDYNTTILDATYVSPTPDTANNTDWIPVDLETGIFHPDGPPAINDTIGRVWIGALVPAPLEGGLNGSFSLVTINFTATAAGSCTLDLYETVLGNSWGNLTVNTVINGSVTVIPDTTKPSISTPTQSPLEGQVQPNQTVTVSVEVTDGQSGVHEVILYYKYSTDGGQTWTTWTNILLNKKIGDIYEGEILGLSAGTRVQYGINALDKAGNTATNNNTGSYYIYTVIPEFSSWIALILAIAITSLAVFLGSRKLNGKHQFRLSKTKDHH